MLAMNPDDERACARLTRAFAYCVDHGRYEELAALFTPDGGFTRPGLSLRGREQILATMSQRPANPVTRHLCGTPVFTAVSAEEATATTSVTLYQAEAREDGPPLFEGPAAIAEYVDLFRRTDEGWRIAERHVVVAMVKRGVHG